MRRFCGWVSRFRRSIAALAVCAGVNAFFPGGNCQAAPLSPEARAAVQRGVGWLKQQFAELESGRISLAAYAMLQGGEPVTAPEIQQAVGRLRNQLASGQYPHNKDLYYMAAVDLMLLEAVDPVEFRTEIESIAHIIVEGQREGGYWDYPMQDRGGDTSQTQYALLGLWAAHRAGIQTPAAVWDKAARWLISTQGDQGGSSYTPNAGGSPTHTMTTAAIGSFALVRRVLFPDARERLPEEEDGPPPPPDRKFGVLQRVEVENPEGERAVPDASNARPQVKAADLLAAQNRGMGWFVPQYRIDNVPPYQLYYLYGLERMAALVDAESIAGHDWHAEGIAYLVKNQQPAGHWTGDASQDAAGTAFAILFIVRPTSKLLGRPVGVEVIGSGLLKGGRGLPSDLSQALLDNGKVQARKIDDPIEKLLAQLEQQDAPQVEAVQQAIVEQVQLGNREELIGQKDRLIRLAQHPDPEIRRTSLWALGRSDDLKLIDLMVRSLRDPDLGVRIEAHNALCALSRKPNGFEGLPNDPLEGVAEDASEQDRQAAIERWTAAAHEKWRAWYLTVRPYDERDDLQEPKARTGRP